MKPEPGISPRIPWMLRVAAICLVAAAHVDQLFEPLVIFRPASTPVLFSDAWNPPLAGWIWSAGAGVWPAWLSVLLMGEALARLIEADSCRTVWWTVLWNGVFVTVFSLNDSAWLVLLACSISAKDPRLRTAGGLVCSAVACLTSTGFAWVFLAGALTSVRSSGTRTDRPALAVAALAVAGCALLHHGFCELLLKPFAGESDWTLPDHLITMSLGRSVFTVLLTALVLGGSIPRLWRLSRPGVSWLEVLVSGVILIAGSGGISSIVLAVTLLRSGSAEEISSESNGSSGRLCLGLLGLVILFGMLSVYQSGMNSLLAGAENRYVNLNELRVRGNCVLTDPDHDDAIFRLDEMARPRVLIDQRGSDSVIRGEHRNFVADLRSSRKERYVRADGSWGGYGDRRHLWDVTVVCLPTSDLGGIRALTMDPAWKILAVDSSNIWFGLAGEPSVARQAAAASIVLLNLEFPRIVPDIEISTVLATGNAEDARTVSMALSAARLPYAALRVLPEDNDPQTLLGRAWAYSELADRCRTLSAEDSLLDCVRAIMLFREAESGGAETSGECRDVVKAIQVLAQPHSGKSPGNDRQRSIRAAIRSGDVSRISNALNEIAEPGDREFFRLIVDFKVSTPAELRDRLLQCQKVSEPAAHLIPEIDFYCGCLALESGQIEDAIADFQRASGTENPFQRAARTYLAQLVRNGL